MGVLPSPYASLSRVYMDDFARVLTGPLLEPVEVNVWVSALPKRSHRQTLPESEGLPRHDPRVQDLRRTPTQLNSPHVRSLGDVHANSRRRHCLHNRRRRGPGSESMQVFLSGAPRESNWTLTVTLRAVPGAAPKDVMGEGLRSRAEDIYWLMFFLWAMERP